MRHIADDRLELSLFRVSAGRSTGTRCSIDINGRMVSIRYPIEVNLIGDSAQTLRTLLPLLQRKEDRSWQEGIEKQVAQWWKTLETRNGAGPSY